MILERGAVIAKKTRLKTAIIVNNHSYGMNRKNYLSPKWITNEVAAHLFIIKP